MHPVWFRCTGRASTIARRGRLFGVCGIVALAAPPPLFVMRIAIPREIVPAECRVAATPDTVKRLGKLGFSVVVESGAGEPASFSDANFAEAGATIVASTKELYEQADIVLKVRAPAMHPSLGVHEVELLKPDTTLLSFLWPAQNPELVEKLKAAKVTAIAMDQVPRISRAQKCDALSSMSNISGYRAVIEAANRFGRFFTGQITAAGKVPPAKVLVIGAGVAGLAAIGAARGLGAIVRAFDTRPAAREQVESMGAEFLEVELEEDGTGVGGYAKEMSPEFIAAEMALFDAQASDVDIIITTALIPGRPAPRLISKTCAERMKPGSVIVDLAAEQGGNCELTVSGQAIVHEGVTVVGYTDLVSRMATQSSQLYGSNLWHILSDMGGAEKWRIDLEDEVVRGALITHRGEVMWPPPKRAEPSPQAAPAAAAAKPKSGGGHGSKGHGGHGGGGGKGAPPLVLGVAGLALLAASYGDAGFLSHLTVFILACFIGWQVIWNVTPALHTPLMSVTNAISGIIVVAGMLQISGVPTAASSLLGVIAVLIATINIAGGFLVTRRMLEMFRR